jgi:AcrR family transcriptional regulator
MSTHAERSEATRRALVAAGLQLFGERGFADAPLEEVARLARVTKGALYHHFDGKEGLFQAVFEEAERAVADQVVAAAAAQTTPRARLRAGMQAFLGACLKPAAYRIVLQEAPAVLGWEAWRKIDSCYFSALLRSGLEAAMTEEEQQRRPVGVLTQIFRGALAEAAQLVADSSDQPAMLTAVLDTLDDLLEAVLPAGDRPALAGQAG